MLSKVGLLLSHRFVSLSPRVRDERDVSPAVGRQAKSGDFRGKFMSAALRLVFWHEFQVLVFQNSTITTPGASVQLPVVGTHTKQYGVNIVCVFGV